MSRPYLRGLLLVSASATAFACSTDRATAPSTDDLANRVTALGFSSKGMEDHGDYVVVEGDIMLEKSSLFSAAPINPTDGKSAPNRPTYQYYTNALVSDNYVRNIVVDLTGIAGASNWADAARNAIADYNASGSAIHMSEGSPGDITFSSVYQFSPGDDSTIARASWPVQGSPSGKPGPTIRVAQYFNDFFPNVGQKEKILVHEFGHTIGLRHDNALNTEGAGSLGANHISGTPVSDPNSVMVPYYDGYPWSGFDQYDLLALKRLYNPINPTMTGPAMIASSRLCTWTVNTVGGVPPYTYSWYVFGPGQFSPNSGTQQTFQSITSSVSGSYYISVNVTDATGWSNGRALPATHTGFGGSYDHTYCQ
jgi:hypothetical protein